MYVCKAHIHVLRVEPTITMCGKCFTPEISTRKNLFNETESMNNSDSGRTTSSEQMLVG